MFTASSSRALSARAAVVERLRRVLFSPQRLLTAGTLACVLACGGYAVGQTPINQYDRDYNIAELENQTLDLTGAVDYYYSFDSEGKPIFNSYAGKTISLGGGTLKLSSGTYFELSNDANFLFDKLYVYPYYSQDRWEDLSDPQNADYAQFCANLWLAREYREPLAHTIDASGGGEIFVTPNAYADYELDFGIGISAQTINGNFTKSGAGKLTIGDSKYYKTQDGQIAWDYYGTTAVTGDLSVLGGTLNVSGDGQYGDATQNTQLKVSGKDVELRLNGGNHTINSATEITNCGELMLDAGENELITVNGALTVDGQLIDQDTNKVVDQSTLWSWGNVEYKNNLTFANGAKGTFVNAADNTGSAKLGDASANTKLIIDGADTEVTLYKGNHTINSATDVVNGGQLTLNANENELITVNGELSVNGASSTLWSWGNIEYKNNLKVANGAQAMFTTSMDNIGIHKFDEKSLLTISSSGKVYANAHQLNVDIKLDGGNLYYANFMGQETDEKSIPNSLFYTYDEKQTPTVLTYNSGRENINNAYAHNNVINRDISGSGSILFSTVAQDSVEATTAANGYTVVIDSTEAGTNAENMFQFTGDTGVMTAFVVVKGGTNFGLNDATNEKNEFNVIGDRYVKIEKNIATDKDGNALKDANGNYIWVTYDESGKPSLSDEITGEYKVAQKSFWQVDSCGMLGFYRDNADADVAPSISAKFVQFYDGDTYNKIVEDSNPNYTTGGARIWIDTSYNGEAKKYKLGEINAEQIAFGRETDIWYDGISKLDDDVKMEFALNAPKVVTYTDQKTSNTNYGGYYDANNTKLIADVFAKPLVAASVVPSEKTTELTQDGQTYTVPAGYTVTINAIDVADFAANEGKMAQAEIDYAKKFDEARKDKDANVRFNDALYNENDAQKVKQTIHNLSLLGHQMLNQHSHVGNPTSAFFGGASLSASTKRGQDAQNDAPLADLPQESAINNNEKEQEEYNPTRGLWASFTHTNVDGATYQDRGVTMHGYDLQRSGIIGGVKRQYDATLSGGLFFGLTMPEIQSTAANGENAAKANINSKMEMTDFQFAGHLEKIIADNWELCLFVGGGHQSMDWERNVGVSEKEDNVYKYNYKYNAKSTGNTLTGTAYLAYRIDMNDRWTIRPTVGIDSEHSWLYNFTEDAENGYNEYGSLADLGYANQMLAQRYRYEDTYYNRNLARVGFTTAFDGAQGWAGLNARAFYSTQLGGKPSALLTYRTVGDVNDANYLDLNFEDMGSHVMGSDAFSVGGGGYMHLNKTKTLTANGDINAIWYKNASTLNVTGGVSYRF